jgi:hypothetical protein
MTRVLACACLLAAFALAAGASAATPKPKPKPAPAAAGKTVRGGKASLAALRGKPVFINVWSSW